MAEKPAHWADQMAQRIVARRGEKPTFVLASGITPSGVVHVGNFREVITVDFVARALRSLGKNVRFIFSWDDFDTFRKVPKNLPDAKAFEKYLRIPVRRMPDPWGRAPSYAEGHTQAFEKELGKVGVAVEFLYQHDRYGAGLYAQGMRTALEKEAVIREILNKERSTPLPDDWVPTAIYCEACGRDEMEYQRYGGEWAYSYKCSSCGHAATTDIRTTKNLKLNWRTDWPMRWAYEGVDFEPGGKDHSSDGGSYATGKHIVKLVYDHEPPEYLQYDFVMIKGGSGKLSSSSGEVVTVSDCLEVYSAQMLRWIFAKQRPNTDFALSFDEDVIKIHDEFDRFESEALKQGSGDKWLALRRTYELSLVDEASCPQAPPFRPGFRELCNRLQICGGDIPRARSLYYASETQNEVDAKSFVERAERAWNWLQKHAPEEFRYALNSQAVDVAMSADEEKALVALRKLIESSDLEKLEPKELNEKIYENSIHGCGLSNPKDFFRVVYQKLINRDQGPRLPSFLKEIGKERLLTLL